MKKKYHERIFRDYQKRQQPTSHAPQNAIATVQRTTTPGHTPRHKDGSMRDGIFQALQQSEANATPANPPIQRKSALLKEQKVVEPSNFFSLGIRQSSALPGLINDNIKRIFADKDEMNAYITGQTDYIGDVKNKWVRLDTGFTVMGETHGNSAGTVEDVIVGTRCRRFLYEPFNEMEDLSNSSRGGSWRTPQLTQDLNTSKNLEQTGQQAYLSPELENVVFKLANVWYELPKFVSNCRSDERDDWEYDGDFYSERVSHYTRLAILVARDVASWNVSDGSVPDKFGKHYLQNQTLFDTMVHRKGRDKRVYLHEMCPDPLSSGDLTALEKFASLGYMWMANYTYLLGAKKKDKTLMGFGKQMRENTEWQNEYPREKHPAYEAREHIMLQKLAAAKSSGYILAGMGDAHREDLEKTHGSYADKWVKVTDFIRSSGDISEKVFDRLAN